MDREAIRVIDKTTVELSHFPVQGACCIILTNDNKPLMQQRPINWRSFPGCLTTFGGRIEKGESAVEGLIRELDEELGAKVMPEDLFELGMITEGITQHKELVHMYFWHDCQNTITGCYEADDRRFNTIEEVLSLPQTMDYVRWSLKEAQKKRSSKT